MDERFAPATGDWLARMGTLRQVVRQELVRRQLTDVIGALEAVAAASGLEVLDLGCGQGTQAIELARRGHRVTGLDASEAMLADFARALRSEPPELRERVTLRTGDVTRAAQLFPSRAFDLVLCHGVLMYLPDPDPLLAAVAGLLKPGGLLSLLVRNGDALALRPGLKGEWAEAARAFDPTGSGYRNRLGVDARADRREELTAALARHGLAVRRWFGVRVLTDTLPDDAPVPKDPAELALLLECEEHAGRTDPYRAVAALTHLIAAMA